jgi:sec-independent protein translocase protein TatB
MLNIGAGEIAVIMVVALLILGPKRLPELARGVGKFLREFRRQTDEVRTTIETEFYRMDRDLLREDPPKNPTPLPSAQPAVTPANALEATQVVPAATSETDANAGNAALPDSASPIAAAAVGGPEQPGDPLKGDATASPPGRWEE